MNTVPRDLIIDVWERHCALEEEPTRVLVEQLGEEQTALVLYLIAQDQNLGEDAEESQLFPLATMIWEAMTLTRGRKLNAVRPTTIERAEAANVRVLEKLEDATELEWQDSVRSLLSDYNQQPLLGFCIEILMAQDEEAPELAPERIGMEMIWLKTVIDCFDQ